MARSMAALRQSQMDRWSLRTRKSMCSTHLDYGCTPENCSKTSPQHQGQMLAFVVCFARFGFSATCVVSGGSVIAFGLRVLTSSPGIPALKNTAIDILMEKHSATAKSPNLIHWVPFIYEHTTPGAGLRELAVDMIALCWNDLGEWIKAARAERVIEGRQEFWKIFS